MNSINFKKIIFKNIFLKIFVLFFLLFSANSVKAFLLENEAPWLVYGIDGLTYDDGIVTPVENSLDSQYVPQAYFVNYSEWSKVHAGRADCEASCAAMGKKCIASFSPIPQNEENIDDAYDLFYCSSESYGEGVIGVVWSIGDFQDSKLPALEACKAKGKTLNKSFPGDNYYWGGIALCQPCTLCASGSGTSTCLGGKKICEPKKEEINPPPPPPPKPKIPIVDNSPSSSGGSGVSGCSGGVEDPIEEDDGCSGGYFILEPDEFSCEQNSISDVSVSWKATDPNNSIVRCNAETFPLLLDNGSPWFGERNSQGIEKFDINVESLPENISGLSLNLECFDSNNELVWYGSDTITQYDPNSIIGDSILPSISVSGLKGESLSSEMNLVSTVEVSWSCGDIGGSPIVSYNDKDVAMGGDNKLTISLDPKTDHHEFMITCGIGRCKKDTDTFSFSAIPPTPIINKFYADPKVVVGYDSLSTTVFWESENTTYCEFDSKQLGSDDSTIKEFPDDNPNSRIEKLNLDCYGLRGEKVSTTTDVILRYPPRIISFTATPSEIDVGGTVDFSYEAENFNYCWIDGINDSSYTSGNTGSGSFYVGQQFSSSVGTYTFVLTCRNDSPYEAVEEVDVTIRGKHCQWVIDEDVISPTNDECLSQPGVQRNYGLKLVDDNGGSADVGSCDSINPTKPDTDAGKCPLPSCEWGSWTEPSSCIEPDDSYEGEIIDEMKRCSITNGPEGEKCEGGQKPSGCDQPTERECISNE